MVIYKSRGSVVKRKYAIFCNVTGTLTATRCRFVVCIAAILGLAFCSGLSTEATYAEAKESSITLSIDADVLSLDLMPGSFGKTDNATITVKTDNFSGYTLKIAADDSTSLVNTNSDEITSISSEVTEAEFRSTDVQSNKWGYRPSQYISATGGINTVVENTNYLPAPTTFGDLLDVTNSANSDANSYGVGFGAKVDINIPAGSYNYTYVLTAVANPSTYNITYDENTQESVSNMPSPNPQIVTLDGGTSVEDSYVTLSDAKPVMNEKKFAGWCDVATIVDEQTGDYICGGTNYPAGSNLPIDQTAGPNITLYAIWVDTLFPVVWNQMGACEFHGATNGNITGTECTEYHDAKYIDTGIALYSSANYLKDYEIHFTIDHYLPSEQVNYDSSDNSQQTFVNDKLSSSAANKKAPGIIVRRNGGNNIEINSRMNDTPGSQSFSYTDVSDVSVFRLNNIIYYSVNGGPLVKLQDISAFNEQFDLTAWFGAYPGNACTGDGAIECTAKRIPEATLSNMYIKLGEYSDDDIHAITFDANGGTPATANYLIKDGGAITALPTEPTYENHIFRGWYTGQSDGEEVTADTVPTASTTYYAHWYDDVSLANITNTNITLSPGESETLNITNIDSLEPYTLESGNISVATVDAQTGEVSAVAAGETTITMTGTISGKTKTITVNVTGEIFVVEFDSQGGSAVANVNVGDGASINPLPEPTKDGYRFDGWYTEPEGAGTKLTTSTVFDSTTPKKYYAKWTEMDYVCKAASELHTETCNRTGDGCRGAGYANGATITYGSLVDKSSPLVAGAAFSCDINYDGSYDEENERFYYYGMNGDNAKLIYYKNISNANESFSNAITRLPDSTTWTNPGIVAPTSDSFAGKVAGFMAYSDALEVCGNSTTNLGTNGRCLFLLEKSNFANTDIQDGYWLGTSGSRVQTKSRQLTASGSSNNASRPAIEVPMEYISLETYTAKYVLTFNPHNETSEFTVEIEQGSAIGADMPADPTYADHLFQGWFTEETGGTKITSDTVPSGDTTYHAHWINESDVLPVTQAIIANDDLTVPEDGQITIIVSNSAELEPYTFSSSDTSIATVDASGVITGVGAGTANIIMTGTISGLTKTLEVDVLAAPVTMRTVTFNANGGSFSDPSDSSKEVEDGTAVGTLPTPTRTNYKFFGWYKDDGTFYEEVYPDEVITEDVTYYAKWVEDTNDFPIVWSEINACTFDGGSSNVSGDYCASENKTKKYIDTAVQLFTETGNNYQKDFEVGFNIVTYDSGSANQATLVNSKAENLSGWPGFSFRRKDNSNFELTERFSMNSSSVASPSIPSATTKQVKISRIDDKIYYSINDGSDTLLQDISANTTRFDTTLWFGATLNSSGNGAQRYVKATLTDMYVRLGVPTEYIVNFDANGGTVSESSRTITIGDPVGDLPTPTPPNENYTFEAWYDESVTPAVAVSASTIPDSNETYVAHYTYDSSDTPVEFNVANNAVRGYQTLINNWVQSPVNLTTFNEASPINDSTWGDTNELSERDYWLGIKSNFETNECLIPSYSDAVKPILPTGQTALPNWTSGSVDCSKPNAYDTKIGAELNVYLDDKNGASVDYADADEGVIHNMIPGQTYYWEKSDDSTVYGYVTATSVNGRRFTDTGAIRNTRDLGGLPMDADGDGAVDGTVAYGRLFRGERLWSNPATELTKLGINKEYDVGNPSEYPSDTKLSDYQNDEVIHYNFAYNSGDENNATSNYMRAWTAVTDIMTDIASNNKNIYFHCRVGADRTGTVAYLLEGLMGVPDEARYEEYAMTNLSGLYDRTRYYKQKASNNALKFVYMMGYVATTQDIYDWYMINPNADATLITIFRDAMKTST